MQINLTGKTALVNASSLGIGRSIAEQLSIAGATVCITARNQQQLAITADQISKHSSNKVIYLCCDLSTSSAADEVMNFISTEIGPIDILVNNAGGPKPGHFLELSEQDFEEALALSLTSSVRFIRAVAPNMISNQWGRIINISSTAAKEPTPGMILSATARSALAAFSKALSIDLAPYGITINTLCPGGVLTDRLISLLKAQALRTNTNFDELLTASTKTIPMGRFATPSEFAAAAIFLCSEQASYITGTSINIDGGLSKSF